MDKSKYQYEGMKWLMELELLNHPQAINTLKLNIFATSTSIKEAELLIYRENKAMLVLLELSWFGRRFGKRRIFEEVQDILQQMLPSFRFRITDDPKIMDLAVTKVKQALSGGKYENDSSTSSNVIKQPTVNESITSTSTEETKTEPGSSEDLKADPKEQPESSGVVSPDSSSDDRKEE